MWPGALLRYRGASHVSSVQRVGVCWNVRNLSSRNILSSSVWRAYSLWRWVLHELNSSKCMHFVSRWILLRVCAEHHYVLQLSAGLLLSSGDGDKFNGVSGWSLWK